MNELMVVSFYLMYVMFPLHSNIALNVTVVSVMAFITDASCSTHGIDTVLMPVLLIKELRLAEFKYVAYSHTASKWQGQNLDSGLASAFCALNHYAPSWSEAIVLFISFLSPHRGTLYTELLLFFFPSSHFPLITKLCLCQPSIAFFLKIDVFHNLHGTFSPIYNFFI